MLLLLVLVLVVGVLVIWGYLRSDPGQPSPTGTAQPKTMPAGSAGGGAAAR
jgi:hypothetical protein